MSDLSFQETRRILLEAAVKHVAFDGWSKATFDAAVAETELDPLIASSVCPQGAIDLAVEFHKSGDQALIDRWKAKNTQGMKIREKVAFAVRSRLEVVTDKEAVRRGSTLFAFPQNSAKGAKLIWGTADLIWELLGDTSEDLNWYTKRATLSALYSSVVLFWLGDDSEDHQATWDFLDRRIENVMQVEQLKATVRGNTTLSKLFAGPNWLAGQIKRPTKIPRVDLPGSWNR